MAKEHACSECLNQNGYQACTRQWVSQHGTCPIDRKPMMPAQLVPDIMTQHFIDELKVFCSFHAEGCCWTGQLDARPGHEENCASRKNRYLSNQVIGLKTELPMAKPRMAELSVALRRTTAGGQISKR